MKIAALVDKDGGTLSFYETGKVELHEYFSGIWTCTKNMMFSADEKSGLVYLRNSIRNMVTELGGCDVFIARTIKGIPYTIFEGLGISIWKLEGNPVRHLDFIREKEEKIKAEKLRPKPEPVPVGDIRDGFFRLDLAKTLESDRTLTSKRIIIPFIRKTVFQRLEIICEHVPRWFASELAAMKYKFDTEDSNDGLVNAIL